MVVRSQGYQVSLAAESAVLSKKFLLHLYFLKTLVFFFHSPFLMMNYSFRIELQDMQTVEDEVNNGAIDLSELDNV